MVSGVEELPEPAYDQAQSLSPQIPTTRLPGRPVLLSLRIWGFWVKGFSLGGFGVLLAL